MTCSLEKYRYKIGTYQQRPSKKTNFKYNKLSTSNPRTFRPRLIFNLLLPIFTYCLGILFLPYALEYYPPTYVPNPDSCSSTPPLVGPVYPSMTFQTRSQYAPWMSEETKNLKKLREEAQKEAARTNNYED